MLGTQRGACVKMTADQLTDYSVLAVAPGSEEAAMRLSTDDDFLDVVAHQARITHATQQLNAYRSTLERWQARELGAADPHAYGTSWNITTSRSNAGKNTWNV
jgi:hypothetical protein